MDHMARPVHSYTISPRMPDGAGPPPPARPRIYELMRVFLLQRREAPWEVVDSKSVQPVPSFFDDEDVDILRLSAAETRGTYVFEQRPSKSKGPYVHADADGRKALIFAREQLLAEVAKKDCNVLLLEGWRVTIMRKGKRQRIEVQYNGRGALAAGKPALAHRQPPFMELLGSA